MLGVSKAPIGSVALSRGTVTVRPPHLADGHRWIELRNANREILEQWEPTILHWEKYHRLGTWKKIVRLSREKTHHARNWTFIIEYEGTMVGQVSLNNIVRGAILSVSCGYWLDKKYWGGNIATAATSIAIRYAFEVLGLHRVEATVQMHNIASTRVLEKNGFHQEGLLERYMHVHGNWCDHLLFALTVEQWEKQSIDW